MRDWRHRVQQNAWLGTSLSAGETVRYGEELSIAAWQTPLRLGVLRAQWLLSTLHQKPEGAMESFKTSLQLIAEHRTTYPKG